MLIDTHCHLNDRHAFPVPELAVEEAREAGVSRFVVVGIDTESSRYAVELADKFSDVFAVVGWHPNHASEFRPAEIADIKELLAHPKVVALGEIGLDYYRDHASKEDQYKCLVPQLDLAVEMGKPVVFHCRDAYADLLDVLEARPSHKYLFHCFAGSTGDAQRAIDLDSWFGVDGPVTYKSADALRETLKTVPLEKLVIETDAPWMAPVPYRGQRNKSAWITYVNDALAETLGVSSEECAALTAKNALEFFESPVWDAG